MDSVALRNPNKLSLDYVVSDNFSICELVKRVMISVEFKRQSGNRDETTVVSVCTCFRKRRRRGRGEQQRKDAQGASCNTRLKQARHAGAPAGRAELAQIAGSAMHGHTLCLFEVWHDRCVTFLLSLLTQACGLCGRESENVQGTCALKEVECREVSPPGVTIESERSEQGRKIE